jgi:hypothetical protein
MIQNMRAIEREEGERKKEFQRRIRILNIFMYILDICIYDLYVYILYKFYYCLFLK